MAAGHVTRAAPAVLLLALAAPAAAQQPANAADTATARPACGAYGVLERTRPTGAYAEFIRAARLAHGPHPRSGLIHRPSTEPLAALCADADRMPWAERLEPVAADAPAPRRELHMALLPVASSSRLNTAYPRDRANGAVWAGRGLSTTLRAGVRLRWGPLSAALAPTVAWQQNRDFETRAVVRPGYHIGAHPERVGALDWPQRMGTASFWTFDPGGSYVRLDARGVALGFSTESLWWGPALRNPLTLGDAAPGVPHAFVGTGRPVHVGIGRLEAEAVWGRLAESEYFDADAANDRRLFAGLVLAFEPRGVPGLQLGAARTYVGAVPADGFGPFQQALRPYSALWRDDHGAPDEDGESRLLALFGRWVLPASGFEVYGEWALAAPWSDDGDAATGGAGAVDADTDRARGYTLGLQRMGPLGDGHWLRLWGELTVLRNLPEYAGGRFGASFYVTPRVRHGYTHRGQPLGAPIGPGSDAQAAGADLYADWGRLGLSLERVRYDDDAYYRRWAHHYGVHGHDVELTVAARQLVFVGPFDIGWGLAYSLRRNRGFTDFTNVMPGGRQLREERNWTLDLRVGWRPPRRILAPLRANP